MFGDGSAYTSVSNVRFDNNVFAVTPASSYSGSDVTTFTGTQVLKIYLDEGAILVGGLSSTGTLAYNQSFGFSGYLVDK